LCRVSGSCPSRSIVHGDYRVARAAFLVAGKRVTSDPGLSSPAETGILGGCRPAAKHSIGMWTSPLLISGRDGQEMIERDVKVTGRSGAIPSFAVCPDGPGPFPGIILYMDAPGIREELRNLARRIAKRGYFCLLPDMYYRIGTLRFDFVRRAEGMRPTMFAAMNSLTNALVTEDTASWLGFLDAQDKVRPGGIGCIGYCMSGRYVTTVAARFPNRFAASASGSALSPTPRTRHIC
jgi:Dienelactone hydrolase family